LVPAAAPHDDPPPSPTSVYELESRPLGRKHHVVRSAQLAMALLVTVAVAATVATRFEKLSTLRLAALGALGFSYVTWMLYGTREATRFVLWHHRLGPAPAWPSPGTWKSALHLTAQFGIAELIVWLAAPAGVLGLMWLVLLPPIGFAVMFLRPPAIAMVSLFSLAVHTLNVAHWHGWGPVPLALPGFAVAVLFTLVFTQIAVSAEKARGEVERLAAELSDANAKLRAQAAQAAELAATRERNRLAREIHDGVGHCLTVVHVQLEAARVTLDRDPRNAAGAIEKAHAMNRLALQEVRRSVSALRTSPLEDRSLDEALRRLVAESEAAGLKVCFEQAGKPRALSAQVALALYRAAQEGLTNCRKHARARSARVALDYSPTDRVRLAVTDDGDGAGNESDGFGLLGLRERAQLLGGTVAVRTAPGEGFELKVEVPA